MTTVFTSLLEQLLTEACTTDVQRLLEEAMADVAAPHQCARFDRFDVTIERVEAVVIVEDVTDATAAGAQTVLLPAFAHALRRRSS